MVAPPSGAPTKDGSSIALPGFLVLDAGRKPIRATRPKALVAAEPIHRFLYGFRGEPHCHDPPGLRPGDESSVVEYIEMLHHRRQLDRERPCELAHRDAILALEPGEDRPPRGVGEGREGLIELPIIVHRMLKCQPGVPDNQPRREIRDPQPCWSRRGCASATSRHPTDDGTRAGLCQFGSAGSTRRRGDMPSSLRVELGGPSPMARAPDWEFWTTLCYRDHPFLRIESNGSPWRLRMNSVARTATSRTAGCVGCCRRCQQKNAH
jgi:hypothetical protein